MAGRQTNTEAVMSQIDKLDELDGTDYDPQIETDDNDEEDAGDDAGQSTFDETIGDELKPNGTKKDTQNPEEKPQQRNENVEQKSTEQNKDTGKQPQFRKQGNNFVDDKNNIVDPRSGQIIAKAGSERRMYEKMQRQEILLNDRSEKLEKYEKDSKDSSTYFGMVKQAGLSMDEIGEAFNIAIQFKQDPVGAAKKVLEQVLALGHNVTDILGADAGNAIEMSGISRMIDERLKPLITPLQQQRATDQQTKEAQVKLAAWLDENEYADVHLNAIDKLVGDNGISPQKAYNELYKFAIKHQLDFSKPLGPQIAERQSARNGNGNNRQEPRAQKSFPTGSRVEPASMETKDFGSNASWDDILRSEIPRN